MKSWVQRQAEAHGMRPGTVYLLLLSPIVLTAIAALGLAIPATRAFTRGTVLQGEQNIVEIVTYVSMLLAAVLALFRGLRARRVGQATFVSWWFFLFAILLVFVAGEEVAWAQHWLGFETPEAFSENQQGETTLHNLPGFHGNTEWLRLAFGLGGLIGVLVARMGWLKPLAASPLLVPCFAVITALALTDVLINYEPLEHWLNDLHWQIVRLVRVLSEYVEMMVGLASLGYVWLNGRKLALQRPGG